MAPIKRRGPRGGLVSTRLPIPNLNSVATHSDNKRLPNEADAIDNCLVSLERGLEKRPGFEVVPQYTIPSITNWTWGTDCNYDLFNLPVSHDLFYYWYSINEDNTFLVVIDFDATGSTDKLFYVFQIKKDGTWKEQTPTYQWDPTDTTIASGNATITSYVGTGKPFATYAAALAAGVVNKDSRAYITYRTGTKTAKESLRVVALGSNLTVLNVNVSAGFSSDTTGKLFGLDGVVTAADDVEGCKLTYYSAAKVMKVYDKGDDGVAGTTDDLLLGWKPGLVLGTVGTTNTAGTAITSIIINTSVILPSSYYTNSVLTIGGVNYAVSAATNTNTTTPTLTIASLNQALVSGTTTYSLTLGAAAYIPASDYYYYNSQYAYLGQRVTDISAVRLPPDNDDWYANNGNPTTSDSKAQAMLKSLYDVDTQYPTVINGRGKIFYTMNPYLNTTSGYYRVISWPTTGPTYYYDSSNVIYTSSGAGHTASVTGAGRPYLQKIRTPDEHSYIDPRRMPQNISVTLSAGSVVSWSVSKIKWIPRTSGDKNTNPGPSVFKTQDGKSLRQVQIKAMAVFKDRLWFAADDVVFSSRTGEYENLFINDPANIITSDPIDVRASSNQYAEISSMVPFEEHLFIDTKAKTQFQLMSSSTMELSPTNVALAPVTFYSTAPITFPQLIGSRLYFFGAQRMYLYVGRNAMGYSSAVEVSSSAAGYLPTNYRSICTAPAQDSIAMVSEENPNEIYLYTGRFSGDRVIQNSFYRYVTDSSYDIKSIQSFNNYLYAITKVVAPVEAGGNTFIALLRSKLIFEDNNIPRMDMMIKYKLKTGTGGNVSYSAAADLTTLTVPMLGYIKDTTRFVLASPWTKSSEDISMTVVTDVDAGGASFLPNLTFNIKGNYAEDGNYLYIGTLFESRIQLSTLFVRDENNNIIDGVLNIRTGVFRHFNTGNYDIEVSHRGRTPLVSSFACQKVDFTSGEDTLSLEVTEDQGEFVAKIFGYSDSTKIAIVSDYTTPMNITNMEFKGKFKQKYSTFN